MTLQADMVRQLEASLERNIVANRVTRERVAGLYEIITGNRAWASLTTETMLDVIETNVRPTLKVRIRRLLNKP